MRANTVKYREMIATDLTERGWTWGFVSLLNSEGRNMFNVDAGCGDGKRFVVRLDQLHKGLPCPRMVDPMMLNKKGATWRNVKSAEMIMTRVSR